MEVKYFSDDGKEFTSKTQCEKYEEALSELTKIKGLPLKKISGKNWYKLSTVGEFYFFDHMDDSNRKKSNRTLYDIAQLTSKIPHRMPYWITKDFEEGIMIDKKRVELIDQTIEFFENKIDELKDEKKELESLRGMEVTDDDFKLLVNPSNPDAVAKINEQQQPIQETQQPYSPPKQPPVPPKLEPQPNVEIAGIEHAKNILDKKGVQLEPRDILEFAMEEAVVDKGGWNAMDQNKRNNLIEEQINILTS